MNHQINKYTIELNKQFLKKEIHIINNKYINKYF